MISRRTFAAALTLFLGGCATVEPGTQPDPESAAPTDGEDPAASNDASNAAAPWLGDTNGHPRGSPQEQSPWVPDLVVLNHQQSSLTVWITVQGPPWSPPAFEETVSIRSRSPRREPLGVAIEHVPVVGDYSTVEFETSWGRRASYRWETPGKRRGVRAHFYDDDIHFSNVGE